MTIVNDNADLKAMINEHDASLPLTWGTVAVWRPYPIFIAHSLSDLALLIEMMKRRRSSNGLAAHSGFSGLRYLFRYFRGSSFRNLC